MMTLKLDKAKTYDRLEWPFIKAALLNSGFPPRVTTLMMSFIRSVTYLMLINGQPSRNFTP